MCGIIGYLGDNNCVPILIEGLKRLEYRGYDSAGISVITKDEIKTIKKTGKIINLEKNIPDNLKSNLGIGHTRWATHGKVSDENAHPHLSFNKKFAIVHNGIIENYAYHKVKLIEEGFQFRSETDSEVIAYLIEKNYNGSFEEAFYKTLPMLEGTYGIVAFCLDEPDYLMIVRKGSPLVIGIGNNEMFVASDVSAFLGHTKDVVYLEDYEIAKLEKNKFITKDFRLQTKDKKIDTVVWGLDAYEKGDYPHYMLKEICEQPESIKRAFAGRIIHNIGTAKLGGLNLTPQELFLIERINIIACGTSYHAGLVGAYAIEELARMNVRVEIASEYRYKNPIIEKNTLFFAVSQSGETIDTLLAMREVQRKGGKVLGICNVVGSSIPRESNGGVYIHSGPEIAVASTKAFTSQIVAFYLFAILMGRMRDLSQHRGIELITELEKIPDKVSLILSKKEEIEKLAEKYYKLNNFLFLGRGISYPVALEGALKLKEVSYLHSEALPSGEIKHGPIALIDNKTPVIFIIPKDHLYEKTLSNIQEVKARGGIILVICNEIDENLKKLADDIITVPKTDPIFSPLLTIIPLQLLAYYIALKLGCDIDKPRNLAKSVTVE
ncbi:MAG TPA: glutamine--fructose-6-phosphate transaminase (isomerizing) [Spirochaetota bacterium]|nr:glutamine--fructose-6-phosphate transaminase (isomerizing) [Spirochaetota bacterium]HPP03435.1 glutamine--fructose-6-phosphate transaminase (isomerizing) [Spirochaetota bacterium]